MVETHAFGNFVPQNAKYLILGSFTGRQAVKGTTTTDDTYDWFYGTKRNQFWSILEGVYGIELRNKRSKQELFTKLGIAMADIIYQCERKDGNNLDSNLVNIVYNVDAIAEILETHQIERILFPADLWRIDSKRYSRTLLIVTHLSILLLCRLLPLVTHN